MTKKSKKPVLLNSNKKRHSHKAFDSLFNPLVDLRDIFFNQLENKIRDNRVFFQVTLLGLTS